MCLEILLQDYGISVVQAPSILSNILMIVIGVLVLVCNFGYGCVIHLPKLREALRNPLPPVTGFVCQFLIMAPVRGNVLRVCMRVCVMVYMCM